MGVSKQIRDALLRVPVGLSSRCRVLWWRAMGMAIGSRCRLRAIDCPRHPWNIKLESHVGLDLGVTLLSSDDGRFASPHIHLGERVYVNRFTIFDAVKLIKVGPDCMLGPFCYLTDHDHQIEPDRPINRQELSPVAPVVLGTDVWLGAGVTVLKGVTIGDGAVVGAGSVVTKPLEAWSIAVGVPAKIVGYRKPGEIPARDLLHQSATSVSPGEHP